MSWRRWIRALLTAGLLSVLAWAVPSAGRAQSVVTYAQSGKQRLLVFVPGSNGHLYVNEWNGTQWTWLDHGLPAGPESVDAPSAVTYVDDAGKQRIYAFVQASDGRLYVNFWDGTAWKWESHGRPAATTAVSRPGAITYLDEAGKRWIHVFVQGSDGHLYMNYWNGTQWSWADQDLPRDQFNNPLPLLFSPQGAVTFRDDPGKQQIYVFAPETDTPIGLYVNHWDGKQWTWVVQPSPPQWIKTTPAPSGGAAAIAYIDDAGKRRILALIPATDVHLHANYWDGAEWKWADLGKPADALSLGRPAVVAYRDNAGKQRIAAFMLADRVAVYTTWDGAKWRWVDPGTPPTLGPGNIGMSLVGAATYADQAKQRTNVFFEGGHIQDPWSGKLTGAHLYMLYWDGAGSTWSDLGQVPWEIPSSSGPGSTGANCAEGCSTDEGRCMQHAHSVADRKGCIADKKACVADCKKKKKS
jgi:hypothetical protein